MVGSPSRIRLVLAVVPPMSKEMTLGQPSACPSSADAMMPPTGPDSIIATGRSVATSGVITPPFERMIERSPANPMSPRQVFRLLTYPPTFGPI